MTGVQAQAADLLQRLEKMDFSLAKKKGQHLDIGELEVIQLALRKQVPRQPDQRSKFSGGICYETNHLCGRCSDVIEKEYKYCPECGQAIDWRTK